MLSDDKLIPQYQNPCIGSQHRIAEYDAASSVLKDAVLFGFTDTSLNEEECMGVAATFRALATAYEMRAREAKDNQDEASKAVDALHVSARETVDAWGIEYDCKRKGE